MGDQATITARSPVYLRFQLRRQHQGVPDRAYQRRFHYSTRRYDRTGPYLTGQPPESYDDLFLDEFGQHQCGFYGLAGGGKTFFTHKMEFCEREFKKFLVYFSSLATINGSESRGILPPFSPQLRFIYPITTLRCFVLVSIIYQEKELWILGRGCMDSLL